MIDDARGNIEYDECGSGMTPVLVPGSCSSREGFRDGTSDFDKDLRERT
jgi:hypothetical protein